MKESDFIGTITGEVRWGMNGGYCYFHPHELPFDWSCSDDVLRHMMVASVELARLDGMLRFIGDDAITMLTMNLSLRESTYSSSIEGTRSTVEGIFRSEKEEEKDEHISMDNQEVVNYRNALLQGFEQLPVGGRITLDMVKDLHRTLMDGVRGSEKSPGEFKRDQNAIGNACDTVRTAKFVPASPGSVSFLLDNWLDYVNSDSVSTVEKLALAHYQFEAIHPFRDGNGRVGRLLTMMILRRDGLLRNPILHLSGYLNSRRDTYIDLMYRVSSEDALDRWVSFISEALYEQARSTATTVEALLEYRNRLRSMAGDMNESRTVDLMFRNPYLNSKDLVDGLGVSVPTANRILSRFESLDVLHEVTGRKRHRLYCATGVLDLLR